MHAALHAEEWLDEIAKYPPGLRLAPGEGTAVIRAVRDSIDRPQRYFVI